MYLCRLIRTSTRSCAAAGAFYCSPSSPEDARPAIKAGDVLRKTRRFSAADVAEFAAVTGDRNPAHLDPDFACRVAGFDGGSVVHGMLVASLFPSVIASNFPGAVYVSQTLQFKLPVFVEDEVVAEVQVVNLKEYKNRYIVKFITKCFKDHGSLLIDGEAMAIVPTLIPTKESS